jgi:hypothetical protein
MYYLEKEVVDKLLNINTWQKRISTYDVTESYFTTESNGVKIEVRYDGAVYFDDTLVGVAKEAYSHAKQKSDISLENVRQQMIRRFMEE